MHLHRRQEHHEKEKEAAEADDDARPGKGATFASVAMPASFTVVSAMAPAASGISLLPPRLCVLQPLGILYPLPERRASSNVRAEVMVAVVAGGEVVGVRGGEALEHLRQVNEQQLSHVGFLVPDLFLAAWVGGSVDSTSGSGSRWILSAVRSEARKRGMAARRCDAMRGGGYW